MIAHLKGTLIQKDTGHCIVDVNGVGYLVIISALSGEALPCIGAEISLHIYTHVREDQLQLFGFATVLEKNIFTRLLNVSGIGPKMALSLLSGLSPNDIVGAVIKEDLARLSAIQGVGKKTAERLVVELRDKFIKEFPNLETSQAALPEKGGVYNDALSALMNLGYSKQVSESTLAKIELSKDINVQTAVRLALKAVSK